MAKIVRLRKIFMAICAVIVFVYLILLCSANPSPQLFFALAVELVSLGAFLYFGLRRKNSAGGRAGEAVISELKNQYALLKWWSKTYDRVAATFWIAAALLLTIDCIAFSCAFFGANRVSLALYRAVPMTAIVGLHPAASLEVLAGAYVEAGKYKQAWPLYEEVLALRLATFGKIHKEIAAVYCDFGDLYSHQNQLRKAEDCYRMALQISLALLGDKGSGRPFTRLADCLRNQGRYGEAAQQYKNAYDMRAHQFGTGSEKVAETLTEWAVMERRQGHTKEAEQMQARVNAIRGHAKTENPFMSACISLVLFCLSLAFSNFFFGRKGVLTELAATRIKSSVDAAASAGTLVGGKAVRGQLQRLITLYRFQKKYDEADRYSAMLGSLGKD